MKAHEYARLLLAGPDLELVHVNTDYEQGECWSSANQARVQTRSDAQDRGIYGSEWRPTWGNEVLIVE